MGLKLNQTIKQKVLVSFSTYNAPHFLKHLTDSLDRYDAGCPYDLLIVDNSSTDTAHLKLLDKLAKRYDVSVRPNLGRAQGGYKHAFETRSDYVYYFFLHDDSAVIRNDWLKVGVDRIKDNSLESCLNTAPEYIKRRFIGKVGYQSYGWGTLQHYFDTKQPAIFRFMETLAPLFGGCPPMFQHINDDRILLDGFMLRHSDIWNIETFRANRHEPIFDKINTFFANNFPGRGFIEPREFYNGADWDGFQTTCEFLNDIEPMRQGYRTHNLLGDGYSQEHLGWSSFWGNEYVVHYGSHNVFKRLGILLNTTEETVRSRYKDINFLSACDNLIRRDLNADHS